MLRPAFAACFGALMIGAVRERLADMLVQPVKACSIGFVSIGAFVLMVAVMACRGPTMPGVVSCCRPRLGGGHQPVGTQRPAPPTTGSGVKTGHVILVPKACQWPSGLS